MNNSHGEKGLNNMNGFQSIADGYKTLVKQGKVAEEDVKNEIKIYEFLATCEEDDIYRLFDSSAFNDILKCYIKKALKSAEIDKKKTDRVMEELRWLLDTMGAKQACESEGV